MSGHAATAVAISVLGATLAVLLARQFPIWLARRQGRSIGLTHLGAGALDGVARLDQLVIGAHRTLTTGHLVVTHVQPLDPTDDRNLRWFAGALAHRSEEPVHRAIAKLAGMGRITGVAEEPGSWIRGSVDRHPVRIGDAEWLPPEAGGAQGSTVGVEVDNRPLGYISVAEEVRRDAVEQVSSLRADGVQPVLVAEATEPDLARVADLAGIADWHAGVDPQSMCDKLGGTDAGVGRAAAREVSAAGDWELELTLPGAGAGDTTVRAGDSSIAAVVALLRLLRQTRKARRVALRVALGCLVVLVPLAVVVAMPLIAGAAALAAVALTAACVVVVG